MFSRAFTITALASAAAAQSLSSGCTNALAAIALNSEANTCLSPSSLIPIFVGSGNDSIVDPVNTWLTSLCSTAPCSNATLSDITTNVTTGCATELSALGYSSNSSQNLVSIVQQYYPTVRQVACLKDSNTNCVTQTLTNIQNIVGPLSVTNIVSLVTKQGFNIPANVTCTNCIKAAYSIVSKDIPSLVSDEAAAVQSQCGNSFTDGTTPSGISESASNAAVDAPASGATSEGAFMSVGFSAFIMVITGLASLA